MYIVKTWEYQGRRRKIARDSDTWDKLDKMRYMEITESC